MELANSEYDVYDIPMKHIYVDESFNNRMTITRNSIKTLIKSIDETGLLFPVIVIPFKQKPYRFKLISGFRRFRAATCLKWVTIPAYVKEVDNTQDQTKINLTENLERREISIFDEAMALRKLYPVNIHPKAIADEMGKPISWVRVRLNLLKLDEPTIKVLKEKKLPKQIIESLVKSSDIKTVAKRLLGQDLGKQPGKRKARKPKDPGAAYKPTKGDVNRLIKNLLMEGFNPTLVGLLAWTTGAVSPDELHNILEWLRDRKSWLR